MIYPIYVVERLYLPRTPSLNELFDELRNKFEYVNPQYVRMKQLKKWTGHLPRIIHTWENVIHPIYGECLSLPRGATSKVRKVFDRYDGVSPRFIDCRLSLPPINVDEVDESPYINNVILRDDQEMVLQAILKYENCLIRSPTGSGKCLAPNTKVIKYDGSIVEARDIRENDLLLGPDNKPRVVTSLSTGYGLLYQITPNQKNKFKPFICNSNHILTLRSNISKKIIDISLDEYIRQTNSYRKHYRLISTAHNNSMGFNIKCIGYGDFIGWSLNSDGRFLLEDQTITHNTEVALKVIEHLLRIAGPVMVIVWESGLFDQWVERTSKRFNIPQNKIGKLTGRNRSIKRVTGDVHPITIAMQQSLVARTPNYVDKIGAIICDEVQRFAAKTFQNIITKFPARYRIGISADERRADQMEFLTYDMFGEVQEEIDKAKLIQEGKIHDVLIRLIPSEFDYEIQIGEETFKYPDAPLEYKDFPQLLNVLTVDQYRNDLIWKFMEPVLKAGHPTFVMTARVDHAMYWNARIETAGYKSGLIIGASNRDRIEDYDNREIIQKLLSGKIQVGVGTIGKIGAAIDIPRCNRMFILTPINNQQKFEQAVGRIRRISDGKDDAVCYYVWDKYLYPTSKNKIRSWYKLVQCWYKIEWMRVS